MTPLPEAIIPLLCTKRVKRFKTNDPIGLNFSAIYCSPGSDPSLNTTESFQNQWQEIFTMYFVPHRLLQIVLILILLHKNTAKIFIEKEKITITCMCYLHQMKKIALSLFALLVLKRSPCLQHQTTLSQILLFRLNCLPFPHC